VLKGRTYEPLFPYYAHMKEHGAFKVVTDTYVTADSGVGVVHQAPAFGEWVGGKPGWVGERQPLLSEQAA